MAKISKHQMLRKMNEFMEFANEVTDSKKMEVKEFVDTEIIPHSPILFRFMSEFNALDHPHQRLGINAHPLVCARCERPTPISVPMGTFNALWKCEHCGIHMNAEEDNFRDCPECKTSMTRVMVYKENQSVSFDYLCKTCRENKVEQEKISQEGGAIVLCPKCHTTGTLSSTDKQVMKFREEKGVPMGSEVRFMLLDTQCPRCADEMVSRVFSKAEENRIFLADEDRDSGVFKEKSSVKSAKKKGGGKRGAGKKSQKPVDLVGVDNSEDEVSDPKPGIFVPHPGTKTFH